ncbi:MAG: hypothetical protein AAGC85_02525 [Bacteroidota bacterium]
MGIISVLPAYSQNTGIGTRNPKNTLHIIPDINSPTRDPIRIERLQLFQSGKDTTVLVCDPDSGVVRYMPISALSSGGSSGVEEWVYDPSDGIIYAKRLGPDGKPVVITDTGKVGIGTSNPDAVLEVTGGDQPLVNLNRSGKAILYVGKEDQVGIGTTSSTNKLHVVDSEDPLRLEGLKQGNANLANRVLVTDENGVVKYINGGNLGQTEVAEEWTDVSGGLVASQAAAEGDTISITDEGALGVGTDNPDQKLTVKAGAWNGVGIQNEADSRISGIVGWTAEDLPAYNNRRWLMLSNETPKVSGTGRDGGIMFRTNPGATPENVTPRMVIQQDGKVGIGTTRPTETLDVDGTARLRGLTNGSNNEILTIDGDGRVQKQSITSLRGSSEWEVVSDGIVAKRANVEGKAVAITDEGRVGIGTQEPSQALDVDGTMRLRGLTTGTNTEVLSVDANGVVQKQVIVAGGESAWVEVTGGIAAKRANTAGKPIVVKDDGKLGVGTANPTTPLHVIGDGKLNGFRTISLSKNVAGAVNSFVDLGTFSRGSGAHSMSVSVNASIGGFSVAKNYNLTTKYNQTADKWQVVPPSSNTGPYGGNDFELLVKVERNNTSLRIRKTGGTVGGVYEANILYTGYTDAKWAESSTNGTDAAEYATMKGGDVLSEWEEGAGGIVARRANSEGNAISIKNDGKVGIGTTNPATPLHVAGDSKVNGLRTLSLSRNVAGAVNSFVDLGTFSRGSGAHSMSVSVNASIGGFSVAKNYNLTTKYNQTADKWQVVPPSSNTGPYGGNDFELLVKVERNNTSLRIRKTGGIVGGVYEANILYTGYTDAKWAESSANGTDAAEYATMKGGAAPGAWEEVADGIVAKRANEEGNSITIKDDGKVGLGIATPTSMLHINGNDAINLSNRSFTQTHAFSVEAPQKSYTRFYNIKTLNGSISLRVHLTMAGYTHMSDVYEIMANYDDLGGAAGSVKRLLPLRGTGRRHDSSSGWGSGDYVLEMEKVGTNNDGWVLRVHQIGATDNSTKFNFIAKVESFGAKGELINETGTDESLTYPIHRQTPMTVRNGKVGIGTAAPTEELHIEGNLRMIDGNEGVGKFLVSDANGVASWQEFNPEQEVKQNKFETRVNVGQLQELGRYLTTEGTAILEITVASPNGGNSGTSTYLWQGGYNQLAPTNTWYKLLPLQQGRGHGSGLSGTAVYIRQSTPYQYDIAVAATVSTKALDITILDKNPANNTKFTDLSENAPQAIPATANEVFSSHSFYAGKVGVGTANPSSLLEVSGNTAVPLSLTRTSANPVYMQFNNSVQEIGKIGDGIPEAHPNYDFGLFAKGTEGVAAAGYKFGVYTGAEGSRKLNLFLSDGGALGLGTNLPKAKLDVAGGMVFSTDGAKVTGQSGLYVNGGELFAFDASGNSTTISPHNFSLIKEGASEEMAWSFYSQKGPKSINVDMAKLARIVEQLSGETLVHIFEDGEITTQEVENSLADKVEALEAENEELKERLARLEALLLGEKKIDK